MKLTCAACFHYDLGNAWYELRQRPFLRLLQNTSKIKTSTKLSETHPRPLFSPRNNILRTHHPLTVNVAFRPKLGPARSRCHLHLGGGGAGGSTGVSPKPPTPAPRGRCGLALTHSFTPGVTNCHAWPLHRHRYHCPSHPHLGTAIPSLSPQILFFFLLLFPDVISAFHTLVSRLVTEIPKKTEDKAVLSCHPFNKHNTSFFWLYRGNEISPLTHPTISGPAHHPQGRAFPSQSWDNQDN